MIIFTHIPKTAGTTLKYILRNNYGIRHIDSAKVKKNVYAAEDLDFAKKIFNKPLALSGHNIIDPAANIREPGAQIITVLRDPLTRCASQYQDEVLRGKLKLSFEQWIAKEEHQNLSVRIITGTSDLEKAKRLLKESYHWVGITERFDESLKLLTLQINEPLNLQYRRMITASSNEIKNKLLLEEPTLKMLKEHNQLDQELYDYTLKEIFLPSLEKYKDEISKIILPDQKEEKWNDFKYKRSVGYNKFVYRQFIKLLNK